MIKIIFSIILITLTMQANAAMSAQEMGDWMANYYLQPNPSEIAPKIKLASESGLLDKTDSAGPPIFGFIAGAVKNNPLLAQKLAKDLNSINEPQYGLILIGIWYANLPNQQSEIIVRNALENHPTLKEKIPFLSQSSVDLFTISPKRGPWVLDAMWGYFMATGSAEPVIQIISVLPWMDKSKKDEIIAMGKPGMYLLATSGSAKWSLTSNAKQHKLVMKICEDQIQKQSEPISSQLKEIVAKAKK